MHRFVEVGRRADDIAWALVRADLNSAGVVLDSVEQVLAWLVTADGRGALGVVSGSIRLGAHPLLRELVLLLVGLEPETVPALIKVPQVRLLGFLPENGRLLRELPARSVYDCPEIDILSRRREGLVGRGGRRELVTLVAAD